MYKVISSRHGKFKSLWALEDRAARAGCQLTFNLATAYNLADYLSREFNATSPEIKFGGKTSHAQLPIILESSQKRGYVLDLLHELAHYTLLADNTSKKPTHDSRFRTRYTELTDLTQEYRFLHT